MSTKGLVAFVVGAALFVLAAVFDPVLIVIVGALVVLIAGDGRAWVLALVASLLSLVHVVAPGPPPPLSAASGWPTRRPTCSTSSRSPLAAVGGLLAGRLSS